MYGLPASFHHLRNCGEPAHYRGQAQRLPPIIVVKRNGSRQSFDRNKILNSMIRAFDKRKVNVEDLDKITTEIEQTIQNSLEREITTDKIGEMILERLKPLDEVAYIRFASVYRRFQDVNSFMREISTLLEE